MRAALELLSYPLTANALVDDTGRAVLELIRGYVRTWRLLVQYDEDSLLPPSGCRPAKGILASVQARTAIAALIWKDSICLQVKKQ